MNKNFNKLLVAALLLVTMNTHAQTPVYFIKTVAGNGTSGFSGDGATATASKLSNPVAVATDDSGNYFIADKSNNRIRKVSRTGVITTIAGGAAAGYTGDNAAATASTLSGPTGIAKDKHGNIYIADLGNHVVRKISGGIITTFAGPGIAGTLGDGGPATAAYLSSPASVAVDKTGNVFIADQGNGRVRMVDPTTGNISTYAGTDISGYNGDNIAATTAQLSLPVSVCVDTFGNLYIVDQTAYRVRKVDVNSKMITTVAGTGIGGYDNDGNAATSTKISYASGVAVDRKGNLFITDNGEVRRVDAVSQKFSDFAGRYNVTAFGGDGHLADTAKLNNAQGMAADTLGNLYIADEANNRIREVWDVSKVAVQQIAGENNTLSIFPNPNNGTFTIKGTFNSIADQQVTISVMNMAGAVIYTGTAQVHDGAINAAVALERNLANGCYLLNITSESQSDIARFVIQK